MGYGVVKKLIKYLVLFLIGGTAYYCIEVAFRGYSHWSMIIVSGIAFIIIGLLNEVYTWDMPLYQQVVFGAIIITTLEFVAGCVLNIWLGWNIWDYSDMPYNLLGQICPQFIIAWVVLSLVIILLDDYSRWLIFKEEKPHYKMF